MNMAELHLPMVHPVPVRREASLHMGYACVDRVDAVLPDAPVVEAQMLCSDGKHLEDACCLLARFPLAKGIAAHPRLPPRYRYGSRNPSLS